MSSKQADVDRNDARYEVLRNKLIVRPTLAGFGVVVANCAACDPCGDYTGCVVVNVTTEYARGYVCVMGSTIAYTKYVDQWSRTSYYTVDPGTMGT